MTLLTIRDVCEQEWVRHKSDCSGFAKAVAKRCGVHLRGRADDIVDQLAGAEWQVLTSGIAARAAAEDNLLVIVGLKGSAQAKRSVHGHVAVVVAGELAHGKYPTAYWGRLGSVGKCAKTLNWAWTAADRDRLVYAAIRLPEGFPKS